MERFVIEIIFFNTSITVTYSMMRTLKTNYTKERFPGCISLNVNYLKNTINEIRVKYYYNNCYNYCTNDLSIKYIV